MAWWHRDPSVWCRSPAHHYARRALRLHEDALRSRCFSASKPSYARNTEDEDGKRPAGLARLEWLQLQQYRRWKRKLQEDPYHALFGASNDMLKGKGLKDWQWVYKSSKDGKGGHASNSTPSTGSSKAKATSFVSVYPKQADMPEYDDAHAKERISPQSSFELSRFERDDCHSGVASPSDSRRPPEPHIDGTLGGQEVSWTPEAPTAQEVTPAKDSYITQNHASTQQLANGANSWKKDISDRETPFMEDFLARPPSTQDVASIEANSKDWRRTTLERRVDSGFKSKPRKVNGSAPEVKERGELRVESAPTSRHQSTASSYNESFLPAMSNRGQSPLSTPSSPPESSSHTRGGSEWLIQQGEPKLENLDAEKLEVSSKRSTSEVLGQLPVDDLDFLSASNIRAAMGRRKPATEEGPLNRQKLEKDFTNAHIEEWSLHPLIESKIINDQQVRRKERELKTKRDVEETHQKEEATENIAKPELTIEHAAVPLTKWLHKCGDIFARHFWQDPLLAPETHVNVPDYFVRGIVSGIRIDRDARKQFEGFLTDAVPASSEIMARLKQNDDNFNLALQSLQRQRFNPIPMNNFNMPKTKEAVSHSVGQLRDSIKETDDICRDALQTLDAEKAGTVMDHERLKTRLRMAADVMHKSTKLTRVMIFGLQARLKSEKEIQDDRVLLNFLDHLLALQDTKLALGRVIDRAMHVYGVTPAPVLQSQRSDHLTSSKHTATGAPGDANKTQLSSILDTGKISGTSVNKAAIDQRLQDEVYAQKRAMRGLSDDGYSRSPTPIKTKAMDESSPLANSLFRPFAAQLGGLGKDSDDTAVKKSRQAVNLKLEDQKLVAEVKKAYEDVYGPITIHHRQFSGNASTSAAKSTKEPEDALLSVATEENSTDRSATPQKSTESSIPETSSDRDSFVKASPHTAGQVAASSVQTGHQDSSGPATTASFQPNTEPLVVTVATAPSSSEHIPTNATNYGWSSQMADSSVAIEEPDFSGLDASINHKMPGYSEHEEKLATTPTNYKILTYDARADEITITMSTTLPPRDTSLQLPLHEALATLESPAKFIPQIGEGFEVVSVKHDMLVLRDSLDKSTPSITTIRNPLPSEPVGKENSWPRINPVDGTTRLSPTGYVGDDVGVEELEFDERRRMAHEQSRKAEDSARVPIYEERDEKKNKKGGGVLKTAIWAGAGCYVIGVVGELLR